MKSEFIFQADHNWRSCHSATICALENGDLTAAWFAGTKEAAADSVILGSKKKKDSQKWSPANAWVNVPHRAAGNPKLFIGPDRALWLIAPVNYGDWCQGGTRLFMKRSYDHSDSWNDLEFLIEEPRILGKNKPLKLKSGIWIIPAENEVTWQPVFLRSDDSGATWRLIEVPANDNMVIQPSVVQLTDGSLLAYARSWEGFIYEIRSKNDGLTWSEPKPTSLPNNNSGLDLTRLNSGHLVLVFNSAGLGVNVQKNGRRAWGPRNPLVAARSTDEGETWPRQIVLQQEESTGDYFEDLTDIPVPSSGEYSYPSIIQSADGMIHIVYTYRRIAIKHVALSEAEF